MRKKVMNEKKKFKYYWYYKFDTVSFVSGLFDVYDYIQFQVFVFKLMLFSNNVKNL